MKTKLNQLAIFGNPPVFNTCLHVGKPNVANRDQFLERVNEMLDRRWFTNHGPFVQELEQRIADWLTVKHCIAVSNATAGLEIAARALGMHSEVIVPSFTFVATAHALQWQGITPVFADINACSHNVEPASIIEQISPRTTGIIGVHVWGRPCDIESIEAIAREWNLRLVFDAAHALGCSHNGRMIGSHGEVEVFSLHATKFLHSFEGGVITTNNDEVADRCRLMRDFGFSDYDEVTSIGINAKMPEVCAAMGLVGLDDIDALISTNRQNYKDYEVELADISGIELVRFNESETNNYQYIIVEVDERLAGMSRDCIVEVLHAEGVLARRYFFPGAHAMEPYRSRYLNTDPLLPETKRVANRVIALPTGTSVAEEDIRGICQIIRLCAENSRVLKAELDEIRKTEDSLFSVRSTEYPS